MSSLVAKGRILLAGLTVATLVVAGCGGAESRKAKHLAKGQAFLADGSFEKARVEFRNALQIAPADSEARYENGVVDEKLGNPREAAQFYQGAIDANADNVRARTALGRLYVFGGAPERALEVIKPPLIKHPDDAGLLTVRAAARIQLKDIDGALQDAQHAVSLAPQSEDAAAVLAGIYEATGDKDKGRALLENAIKVIPGTVDLRLALAQLYASEGQEPQVEALLLDLIRLKPNERAHRLRLAQYYAHLNHVDEAERVLREGIKALPNERGLKLALIDFLAARRSHEVAAKELGGMIASNPTDYELKIAQAQFYEEDKQYPQAQAVYEQVIADAGWAQSGVTARNRLAALKIETKDVAGAQALLGQVLTKNPRDNDALLLRGNLELAQKDPKSAIADLRSVLRDQPNAVGVMRALARAHLANGEPALAEETMRRAVDANPADPGARLDLAQLLAEEGKPEQARPVIDELVKQQPNDTRALDTQFRIALATKDFAAAKGAADAMVVLQPKVALGYYYQGMAAELDKRLEDADKFYSTSLDLQPDGVEPLQADARVLVKLNRGADALKRVDAAIAQFPELPAAANVKGELLMSLGRAPDAEAAFKMAIERQPKWWTPYRGLAEAQSKGHDPTAAMSTLQAGIAAASSPEALQVELAGMFEQAGKPEDAMQLYSAVLAKNPHADIAANNLAMLLITHNHDKVSLDRAADLAQRFSTSSNPDFLDTYGWVLYKRGDSAAAVQALQSALAKTPDSPASLYHLGMAQASAGQDEAARDSLSRSLKSGKSFSGMDEARATLDKLAKLPTTAASPRS
jgi:tetratricopeptide (TPR) repeat protein